MNVIKDFSSFFSDQIIGQPLQTALGGLLKAQKGFKASLKGRLEVVQYDSSQVDVYRTEYRESAYQAPEGFVTRFDVYTSNFDFDEQTVVTMISASGTILGYEMLGAYNGGSKALADIYVEAYHKDVMFYLFKPGKTYVPSAVVTPTVHTCLPVISAQRFFGEERVTLTCEINSKIQAMLEEYHGEKMKIYVPAMSQGKIVMSPQISHQIHNGLATIIIEEGVGDHIAQCVFTNFYSLENIQGIYLRLIEVRVMWNNV